MNLTDIGRYTKWHFSGLIGEKLVVKEIIDVYIDKLKRRKRNEIL